MKEQDKINMAEEVLAEAYRNFQPQVKVPDGFADSVMAEIKSELSEENSEELILFRISWIAAGLSAAMLVLSTFIVFYHNDSDDYINRELQSYFQLDSYDSIITDIAE
jgi:hypothetical protein